MWPVVRSITVAALNSFKREAFQSRDGHGADNRPQISRKVHST